MPEVCDTPAERARNAHARVLQRLQAPGTQVALAVAMGASESHVSRIKNERLAECLVFLYAAGFRVVESDKRCIKADALDFLRDLAARALADPEQARLILEDE